MIHVHKSGGTSLHDVFIYLNKKYKKSNLVRHKWFEPPKSREIFADEKRKILSTVTVGTEVEVFWRGKFYPGIVRAHHPDGARGGGDPGHVYTVRYPEGGEMERLNLAETQFRVIGGKRRSAAAKGREQQPGGRGGREDPAGEAAGTRERRLEGPSLHLCDEECRHSYLPSAAA